MSRVHIAHPLALTAPTPRWSFLSPVNLPAHAKNIGVGGRDACIYEIYNFAFVVEVQMGPGVLPPSQADGDVVIKATQLVGGIWRYRSDRVVAVGEVDPRIADIKLPGTPSIAPAIG